MVVIASLYIHNRKAYIPLSPPYICKLEIWLINQIIKMEGIKNGGKASNKAVSALFALLLLVGVLLLAAARAGCNSNNKLHGIAEHPQ